MFSIEQGENTMIKISDKYSIDADEYQFVVVENKIARKGKNAGEAYQTTVAYVNDITHALEVIYGRETRKWAAEHKTTLKETVKAFQKIAREITEFGKQFNFDEAANANDEPKSTEKPKRTRSKKA